MQGKNVQVAEVLRDFHSPVEEGPYAWEIDMEYRDYQQWLGRLEDGRHTRDSFELVFSMTRVG